MLEALIPYLTAPERTLIEDVPIIGELKLQVFGPLVATGVILGWFRSLAYARFRDIHEDLFRDYLFWMLVTAFVISHWVSVIFYFPHQIEQNPWVLLYFWNGLSSVGGFFGAFIGMMVYLRLHKQPVIVYADATIFGLLLGWCFGRAGCALVHDHPGRIVPEGTFLAVGPWPDGTWRYDLGLLEFFFALALMGLVYGVIDWRNKRPGWLVGFVVTCYAPFRFVLDFFRADKAARGVIPVPDARYLGLTPAQWFTLAFLGAGIYLMFFRKPKASDLDYTRESERPRGEGGDAATDDAKADAAKAGAAEADAATPGAAEADAATPGAAEADAATSDAAKADAAEVPPADEDADPPASA